MFWKNQHFALQPIRKMTERKKLAFPSLESQKKHKTKAAIFI
jgi:hypothetical protein